MSEEKPTPAIEPRLFKGVALQPFTPQRQSVALEMGMRYGFISEEDQVKIKVEVPIEKPKKGQPKTETVEITVYKQMFKDAAIVVWLCLQNGSRVFKAERRPDEAASEMWKWAEANGIGLGTPMAEICNSHFMSIMGEIAAAKTMPVPNHPGDGGEDDEGD